MEQQTMTGPEALAYFRNNARHDAKAGAWIFRADSFAQTVDAAAALASQTGDVTFAGTENRTTAERTWYGAVNGNSWAFGAYENFAGWRAAMLAGDERGRERVAKFAGSISAALVAPVSARRRTVRGPQGDEVCPHKILSGRLETAWTMRKRATGRAPAPVAILVPMTSNADASPDSFAWRAAAALALAGPMQRAGYRVTIIAADCVARSFTAPSAPRYTAVFHRVASGAGLDIPRATAAISAPHLRFATFLALCAAPWAVNGGLGHAVDDQARYVTFALASGIIRAGEEILTIPATLRDERSARQWLAETSKRYGAQA
jgi:hypothetical protein